MWILIQYFIHRKGKVFLYFYICEIDSKFCDIFGCFNFENLRRKKTNKFIGQANKWAILP